MQNQAEPEKSGTCPPFWVSFYSVKDYPTTLYRTPWYGL
jgi:hypothetical protein